MLRDTLLGYNRMGDYPMQDTAMLEDEIQRLKEQKNAIILVHNYQRAEVQDIADVTGDSLELARAATEMDCDVIVFCGVDFMAETAAILSPEKTVLLPAPDACCPMAGMVTADELRVCPDPPSRCSGRLLREYDRGGKSRKRHLLHLGKRDEGGKLRKRGHCNLCAGQKPWAVRCTLYKKNRPPLGRVLPRPRPLYPVRCDPRKRGIHGCGRARPPRMPPEVIDLADHVAITSGIISHVKSAPGRRVYHRHREWHSAPARKGVPGQTLLSPLG